jgi:hypothetical protein
LNVEGVRFDDVGGLSQLDGLFADNKQISCVQVLTSGVEEPQDEASPKEGSNTHLNIFSSVPSFNTVGAARATPAHTFSVATVTTNHLIK